MTLTSNNERITDVELTNHMSHLEYRVDGHFVEVDGQFDFIIGDGGEYTGIRECALVRDERCYDEDGKLNDMVDELPNDGVLEEIFFEAYFD